MGKKIGFPEEISIVKTSEFQNACFKVFAIGEVRRTILLIISTPVRRS